MSLRRWQLVIVAIIAILSVTAFGFYTYAKHRVESAVRKIPGKLAANISQKAVGFTYSKSEGGRTIFTIKASEVTQFKDGIHAELRNVSILVYGREGNRYDQIYGDHFAYDQKTGEVRANGPVSIDLEPNSNRTGSSDQSAPEIIRNPIHLKTSGLVFNQNTGIAETAEKIEFRLAEGEGSAVGVFYDTRNGVARFHHDVSLTTHSGNVEQTITAANAEFVQNPERRARLEQATIRDAERITKAPLLDIYLTRTNTIERAYAPRGIDSRSLAGAPNSVTAQSGSLFADSDGQITRAELTGNVHAVSEGTTADSSVAKLEFLDNNILRSIDLMGDATLRQPNGSQIQSESIHLDMRANHSIERASTAAPATVTIAETQRTTTVTGDRMNAAFDAASHIQWLHAAPNVKVLSVEPDTPIRTTTADNLDAAFRLQQNRPVLAKITETGNVRIVEGSRTGSANRADYDPGTRNAVLTGSPRLSDTGMSVSAERIEFESGAQRASSKGDVRIAYSESKPGDGGTLFSNNAPIHAIASNAVFTKRGSNTVATLTGAPARLWQGSNVVLGPKMDFDRDARTLVVIGGLHQPVTTTFVQQGSSGKLVPVTVTGQSLRYSDDNRRADFQGSVRVRGEDATITSDRLTVLLYPAGHAKDQNSNSGEVREIVAIGSVTLEQPGRRGNGEQLTYLAQDASFHLTGASNSSPSIFDAEHGSITGDSLTFYSHDDRVLVESQGKRTVTHTRLTSAK